MTDTPNSDLLPPQDSSENIIDQRTGLRPTELNYLKGLSEAQRAAIVNELGGSWPEEQVDTDNKESSRAGDIALNSVTSKGITETVDEPNETEGLSAEKRHAIESIVSNPAISVGIDYWDEGAAYSALSRYKIKRVSDETRDSELLRQDFDRLLLLSRQDVQGVVYPETAGVLSVKLPSAVIRLENEDGVTYKLVMASPKAVKMRPDVDMIVSIPKISQLEQEIEQLDSDPELFLELFKAFAGDKSAGHRESRKKFKLAELADGVRTPMTLSAEQMMQIIEAILTKQSSYTTSTTDRVPPLHPAPETPARSFVPPPPPQSRRFGRRKF